MKRVIFGVLAALALLFCAGPVKAQKLSIPSDSLGYCFRLSAPGNQLISASCTVTVYDAGTTNIATIYSTAGGAAQVNPFAAGINGTWRFYATGGNSYDIRLSGGNPAMTPYTIANVTTSSTSFGAQAAYTVYGNCTAAPAVPSFCSIVNAMMPAPGASGDVIFNTSNLFTGTDNLTFNNTTQELAVRSMGTNVLRFKPASAGSTGTITFGSGTVPSIADLTNFTILGKTGTSVDIGLTGNGHDWRVAVGGTNSIMRCAEGAGHCEVNFNDGNSGAGVFFGPKIVAGFEATPNMNYVAEKGSLYMTTGGSTTTSVWAKETGSGNTGWQQFAMQDDVQTLTNKNLSDTTTFIVNAATPTKRFAWSAVGITAAKTVTFASTATLDRTVTYPDAAGTVSYLSVITCGTSAACSPTTRLNPLTAIGSAALDNASPSLVTITGISPAFTSNATYKCSLTNETATTHTDFKITYVSGSSFTITSGDNTVTDQIGFVCTGY